MSSLTGSRGPTGSGVAGYRTGSVQQYTPDQMKLFKSLFSNVSPDSYLSRLAGGDQGMFDQIEKPQLRQFNNIQGNIASRFSGMGSGARRSSGFQNTLNAASSDFAENLGARRQELQRQALKDLMSMSGELLGQRPYQQYLTPQAPSFLQSILGGAGNMAGQFGGALAGGFGGGLPMKMLGLSGAGGMY